VLTLYERVRLLICTTKRTDLYAQNSLLVYGLIENATCPNI